MQCSLVLRPAPLPAARPAHGRRAASLPAARRRPRQLTVAMAAPVEAVAPIKKEEFDPARPPAFYLPGDGRAELEALADVVLVVQGARLPAHSTVLSMQSRVLRSLCVDLKSGSASEETAGCNPTPDRQPVLEEPFKGATLFDAALFLRFCYQPRDLTPVNLAAVPYNLPGLLRLAHKLDAPLIQQAVIDCMAARAGNDDANMFDLIDWVAAADHCQLLELRSSLVTETASHLTSWPGSAFVIAAQVVEACRESEWSPALQTDLLGAVTLEARRATNCYEFEWVLEGYSQQPSAVGQFVCSPWFWAPLAEWRFIVYPGGKDEEAAGHLSVYLECKHGGVRAAYTIRLADQDLGVGHIGRSEEERFAPGSPVGWSDFICHKKLHSRPGYLVRDRLILLATVKPVQ